MQSLLTTNVHEADRKARDRAAGGLIKAGILMPACTWRLERSVDKRKTWGGSVVLVMDRSVGHHG